MLAQLLVVFILFTGLAFTLSPRLPGTVVIFAGAVLYGVLTGFDTFSSWLGIMLILLMIVAELGGRWLRVWLTHKYSLSRSFSVNSLVANFGGILAADALLGPVFGVIVWEFIAGKTLEFRGNTVARIVLRLFAAAALRFACGLVMVALVLGCLMG